MPSWWSEYIRPQTPLTNPQRMAKLTHELNECVRQGSITEAQSLALMRAALKILSEEWREPTGRGRKS